ncbi:MAG: 1-deoxy-D-xylulose-5-phosphate reductoisomerase [Betaproteobacteria bacterium]|nr:1-deoxy-D-xylulose-5-phosphate reductoisomerase [Betaproteobacteria bacterium]
MSSRTRKLAILGATGSIGRSTMDVVLRHRDRYEVVALGGHRQVERLAEQCLQVHPRYAVVADEQGASILRGRLDGLGLDTEVLVGATALEQIASLPEVDTVMAAIVGAAGLRPTLAAARAGKRILLANKESLVMAGSLLMREIGVSGARVLPIDSEHNAIFQSMPDGYAGDLDCAGISRLVLTASGGPFRNMPLEQLEGVTPEQACAHPNWVMGRKISVDSATMMNKGLEVIEAHWLFGAKPSQIEVVIHPQSVIHSMVQYVDGSVIAQLGNPDMRTPIAHALAYPERIEAGVRPLDLCEVGQLSFERPDPKRFPCLRLAYEALERGGTACAILNATNEEAVEDFLAGGLPFRRIADVIAEVLDVQEVGDASSIDELIAVDQAARALARKLIGRRRT